MSQRVLSHLEQLVSCDTQNPPRAITAQSPIYTYCAKVLREAGCAVQIDDLGGGCVNLLATRGETDLVFNCHLDTVPADPNWSRDPFSLTRADGDAIGLGACDIKGAAACMLAAAQDTDAPLAILLTSDEEAGDSVCLQHFFNGGHEYTRAVVAEPTRCKAVTRHRGIETFELEFSGQATHSSSPHAHRDNALHLATRWGARAVERMHDSEGDNLRFSIGIIRGGVKTNIASSSALIRFGIRPNADTDVDAIIEELLSLVGERDRMTLTHCFSAPALDSGDAGRTMIEELGLERAEPVDFWTEAALFAATGYATIVLGPGDIGQAHTPDEAAPVTDLARVADLYTNIINHAAARRVSGASS